MFCAASVALIERRPTDVESRTLEYRRVAAFRKLDHDRIRSALLPVVAHQPRAQAAGLHAHDRVSARIEGGILVEDLHADDVFLELVAVPVERLETHELQESLQPIDLPEGRARQNPIQLLRGPLCRRWEWSHASSATVLKSRAIGLLQGCS